MNLHKQKVKSIHKELEYYLTAYRRNKTNKGVDDNGMIPVYEDKDIEQLYWLIFRSSLVNDLKLRLIARVVSNFMDEYALKELTGIDIVQNILNNKLNYRHEQFFKEQK